MDEKTFLHSSAEKSFFLHSWQDGELKYEYKNILFRKKNPFLLDRSTKFNKVFASGKPLLVSRPVFCADSKSVFRFGLSRQVFFVTALDKNCSFTAVAFYVP